MGFPLGYSELFLPKLLLNLVFLLGYVRRAISWAFDLAGLGDLLLDSDAPWPDHSPAIHTTHTHHYQHTTEYQSVSAMLIQEILPVVKFGDLASSIDDSCAVCLYEFDPEDEVRRLSNCRHVFHRSCLDRWMEHEQRTCPLCRTALIPEEMQDAFSDRMWAAAGLPDSEAAYSPFTSPAFSLAHQLIAG